MIGNIITNILMGIIITFVGTVTFALIPILLILAFNFITKLFKISLKITKYLIAVVFLGSISMSGYYTVRILTKNCNALASNIVTLDVHGIFSYLFLRISESVSVLFKISIVGTVLITTVVFIILVSIILIKIFNKKK